VGATNSSRLAANGRKRRTFIGDGAREKDDRYNVRLAIR
jgi:hypothetical protein